VTLKGRVTKVDWRNPHIYVYLNVKDDTGKVTEWACEGGPPNVLLREGWTRHPVKEGDEVTIDGAVAKDGSKRCNSRSVNLADGRKVFAGSSEDSPGGASVRLSYCQPPPRALYSCTTLFSSFSLICESVNSD
jgi:hypothetical protein